MDPTLVTNGVANFHGVAPGQHSSKETLQWWRQYVRFVRSGNRKSNLPRRCPPLRQSKKCFGFNSSLGFAHVVSKLLENQTKRFCTSIFIPSNIAGVDNYFTRRARFGKTVEAAGRTLIGKQGEDLSFWRSRSTYKSDLQNKRFSPRFLFQFCTVEANFFENHCHP